MTDIIDKIASGQHKVTVKYTGLDEKEHQRTVTFNKPGWRTAAKFRALLSKGNNIIDLATVYSLIMTNIVADKITFNEENDLLKEKYPNDLKDTITVKNDEGKDVKINAVFPGFREASYITGMISENNGNYNPEDAMDKMIKLVFKKDDKGSNYDDEFFDQFLGSLDLIIQETVEFLSKRLDFDGFESVMNEAVTFLLPKSKQSI